MWKHLQKVACGLHCSTTAKTIVKPMAGQVEGKNTAAKLNFLNYDTALKSTPKPIYLTFFLQFYHHFDEDFSTYLRPFHFFEVEKNKFKFIFIHGNRTLKGYVG